MKRIASPQIEWQNETIPGSAAFDDIYYNRQNGLEESRLVYLGGNDLPHNWMDKPHFVIAETGFGTGLNFLATCALFEETAPAHHTLDYISIERFPMTREDIQRALEPFDLPHKQALLEVYPLRIPGFHRRWITDRITLTVIFDEAARALSQMTHPVDAWFLDGFSPKKNPEMWSQDVFAHMARLSHNETTCASFTAAGDVRRGLKDAGFTIQRKEGYGYRYHRTVGRYTAENAPARPVQAKPEHVTIIGAGLAGAACAFALKRRGIVCTVHEKQADLGLGASGNRLGLINPKLEAQDNARNDCGLSAFSFATHILGQIGGCNYHAVGADHFAVRQDREDRLLNVADKQSWLPPHMEQRGTHLWFPDAATLNTRKLVQRLLDGVAIHFNSTVHDLSGHTPVIIANGYALQDMLPQFPLQPVRGQVTYATVEGYDARHSAVFGRYIAAVNDTDDPSLYALGATFLQDCDDASLRDDDDNDNIHAVREIFPQIAVKHIVESWAGVRSAAKDRFPIAGKIFGVDDVYISGALGSHGIQFSLLHAEIIACMLSGTVPPIGKDALAALSPQRFLPR